MSDIVDLVAAIVWPIVILGFLWYFRKPIRTQLLPRMTGFQGFGLQLTFAAQALTAATDKRPDISDSSRSAAVARLQREGHVLNGTRILWVDDTPSNNFNERRLFERAGAIIDPALSTTEALKATQLHPYDLIISDWKRGQEETLAQTSRKRSALTAIARQLCFMPESSKAGNAARRLDSPTAPMNSYTSSWMHFTRSVVGATLSDLID